ncbi:MAG: tape measure protein, partial [Atopobiaceae bacterium]|nr:tape measure protein [Atopobiaceae bacterium]
MSRTEVGSAYVSIYPDTSHFTDDLSKELGASSTVNAMSSAGEKAGEGFNSGFSAVTVALGNIMSNVIMGAVNLFTENLDRGIARLDTIQNFPRLMQTFGFSTDVAAESVQNIQEHLDGLPGSTDEVLRLVQAISDSTGSLELATSTGLAFNDMLTASGADAYTSMMAMRMFDQMMGGAQFTTMRWMALVSKMPLQMNMVAEEILGAGASAQELGNALQDGEVTMKDVAEAMTKLAPQFTVQARAFSYGIGTAMRNFGNRVALGIAAILDAIGQRRISGIINNISYGIRDALKFVADGVEWLRRVILTSGIGVLLGKIGDSIKEAFSNIDWEPLKEFIRNGLSALHDALQWIIDNSDIVKSLLVGIATAIGTLVVIDTVKNAIAGLSAIFAAIAATPMITVIAAITAGLVYFFTQTERGREILASFMEVVSIVIDFLGDAIGVIADGARVFLTALVQTVIDAASFIWNAAAGFIELVIGAVQGIWDFLGQAWDAGSQLFLIIAEFIGNTIAAIFDFVGAIVSKVMEVLGNVRSFTDWVIDGIIAVVAALVGAVAQAVGQLITDIGNTGAKIAEIWMNVK